MVLSADLLILIIITGCHSNTNWKFMFMQLKLEELSVFGLMWFLGLRVFEILLSFLQYRI